MTFIRPTRFICVVIASILLNPILSYGLSPNEVLVVANMNAGGSKGLATYYMEKRQIPKKNLILLFMTDKETCARAEYEQKAVPKVRQAIADNPEIRAIVTLYGLPIRVASPGNTPKEQKALDEMNQTKKRLDDRLKENNFGNTDQKLKIEKQILALNTHIKNYKRLLDKTASFDSALMLVKKKHYELNSWLQNPFFLGFGDQKTKLKKEDVLMVSRLDGADTDTVKRVIDDSMAAEKEGLKGSAYFDARWKDPGDKKVQGYAFYDRSIHRAAKIISEKTAMKVVLNDDSRLFGKGECPDTALYCGWYSLARYIDAFTWQKGSVGFHIASSECATLKNKDSRVWCKKMLDNGIAATIGPVGEPYVQAFPIPEIFFSFLSEGYLTLAESYLISLPYLSWKMVLIGDPLYTVNIQKAKKG